MELALFIQRTISLFAVVCLFSAVIGCNEQPSSPPVTKDSKKAAPEAIPVKPADKAEIAPPQPSEEPAIEKENKTSEDVSAAPEQKETVADTENSAESTAQREARQKETVDKLGPLKADEQPMGEATENKEPAETVTEDKEKQEEKKATEEEKPMTDEEIAADSAARRKAALKEIIDKLGPPLVENVDKLKKADPLYPVWIDKENKRIVLQGVVCQTNAPLEMFAVLSGTKEHEAIVAVPTEAFIVHAALMGVGATPGKPVQFGPKPADYQPATGTEIDITVKWKDDKGKVKTARAQEWIKNVKTGKDMTESWVFGGSGFWKDEQSGIEYYKAEGGDFICVSNFPSAMLDLPIESSQSNDALMFQANSDRIPPRNTALTIILTPKLKDDSKTSEPKEGEKNPENEKTEAKK